MKPTLVVVGEGGFVVHFITGHAHTQSQLNRLCYLHLYLVYSLLPEDLVITFFSL